MLRRALPEDAERIAGWLSRPEVNRYLTSNLRGVELRSQLVQVALRRPDQAWFVFSDADSERDAPVGLVALDGIDEIDGVANLWFVLGEQERAQRGLTSTAIKMFCEDNPLGLRVAMAWAAEVNEPSLKCLARSGFCQTGRVDNAFSLMEGGRCARLYFSRGFGVAGVV